MVITNLHKPRGYLVLTLWVGDDTETVIVVCGFHLSGFWLQLRAAAKHDKASLWKEFAEVLGERSCGLHLFNRDGLCEESELCSTFKVLVFEGNSVLVTCCSGRILPFLIYVEDAHFLALEREHHAKPRKMQGDFL